MTTKELVNCLKNYKKDYSSPYRIRPKVVNEIIQRLKEYEEMEEGMKRRRDLV